MTETDEARIAGWTPRLKLPAFLAAVLVTRGVHLALLGTSLTGMNPKMAVLAKDWGRGTAFVDVPPGPVLLLAWLADFLHVSPAAFVPAVVVIAHVLLALGFWYWVQSLNPTRALAVTSLVLFVFLPCNNSYIGFDNFPVVFSAAAFFGAAGIWQRSFDGPLTRRAWVCLIGLAAAIPLFRSDYLLFLPLYCTIVYWGYRAVHGAPPRRTMAGTAVMISALGVGTLSVMLFRYCDSGQFELAPKDYTCWTFLDGTPPAWQRPGDCSEADRVNSGIAKFGDPAQYDYSVARMIWHNPGRTVQKFVLNLPSWLFELGRRHVVVPLPLAALAALGFVGVLWLRAPLVRSGCKITNVTTPVCHGLLVGRVSQHQPTLDACEQTAPRNFETTSNDTHWSPVIAAILMTLPLAGIIVSARYMMPAFGAVCVFAAAGLLMLVTWFHGVLHQRLAYRTVWWIGMIVTCVTLELLLLRGGGLLRDAVDLRPVAKYLDGHFGESPDETLVLDPYSPGIDGNCRASIGNRQLHRAMGLSMYGFDPHDPLAAATSPAAKKLGLRTVVYWTQGDGSSPADKNRLAEWKRAGFLVAQEQETYDDNRRFRVFVLRTSDTSRTQSP